MGPLALNKIIPLWVSQMWPTLRWVVNFLFSHIE